MGVLLFLIMINDLRTEVPTYKYVDDTTIYRITNEPKCPMLQEATNHIIEWSSQNVMRLNAIKTKELFVCFNRFPPDVSHITIDGAPLVREDVITLLGLKIQSDLGWGSHIKHVVSKAQRRIYSLVMLRRANVSPKDLVVIFCSKIRPVIEYAAQIWHPGLTVEQSNDLERIQIRAL